MAKPIGSYGLYKALLEAGYKLPDETANVILLMSVDSIMQLQITVNVTDELLQQLGEAFIDMAIERQK